MSKFGDALIVAGIMMMLISLYLAYMLYASLSNQAPLTSVQTPPSTSSSEAIGVLVNNISLTVAGESYIILKIVIFFLVASIGYKFARLGIQANRLEEAKEREEEDETQQPARKGRASANSY